jgi:hypothetical protein
MPNKQRKPLSVATVANRLKYVREIMRLSRGYLQDKYHMPATTLKSWENGLSRLTDKGIKRCIEIYRKEGMLINRDWLLSGKGLSPRVSLDMGKYLASDLLYVRHNHPSINVPQIGEEAKTYETDENKCILREAAFFKESYKNAVVLMVNNNDMEPVYHTGDYVGGRFLYGKDIKIGVKRDCIVRLKNGELLLRRLFKNGSGNYNLACVNPSPNSVSPIMFDVDIESVAPVIWHRIPNPSEPM